MSTRSWTDHLYQNRYSVSSTFGTGCSHLLITRDFNIHIDVTDDPDALRLHDLLESTGLEQHVTVLTHIILFLYSMDRLSLLRSLTSPL